jgi:hypothetical protein
LQSASENSFFCKPNPIRIVHQFREYVSKQPVREVAALSDSKA